MSDWGVIKNTLREIQTFLHDRLNGQFMTAAQTALTSINQLLGDPNIQANLKDTLNKLGPLLQTAKDTELVEKTAGAMQKIQELLNEVDPKDVGDAFKNIKFLSKTVMDQFKAIEDIIDKFKSVSCVSDLVKVTGELSSPAKFVLYGSVGAIIGMTILNIARAYSAQSTDKILQETLDKLVALTAQQLSVQIKQYRLNSVAYLQGHQHLMVTRAVAQYQNPGIVLPEDDTDMEQINEAIRVKAIISTADLEDIKLWEEATRFGKKMFQDMYQPQLDNKDLDSYLSKISEDMRDWGKLVEYVTHYPQYRFFWKKEKPDLLRNDLDLNYNQICRLFGSEIVCTMMNGLTDEFVNHGGSDLFYAVVNDVVTATTIFSDCIREIHYKEDEKFPPLEEKWGVGADKLLKYYRDGGAEEYLTNKWNETDWPRFLKIEQNEAPRLTPEILNIIRVRALLELCCRMTPWFCGPHSIPRGVYNGIIDIPITLFYTLPVGLFNTVRHPINAATGLYNGVASLGSLETWQNIGASFLTARTWTTLAVGTFLSGGIDSFVAARTAVPVHAPLVKAPLVKAPLVKAPLAKASLVKAPLAKAPLVKAPLVKAPLVKAPLASVHGPLAKTSAFTKTSTVVIVPPVSSTIHVQPTDIQEDHQETTLSILPPPVITNESFSNLMENLRTTKDIFIFYDTIGKWYEDISEAIPSEFEAEKIVISMEQFQKFVNLWGSLSGISSQKDSGLTDDDKFKEAVYMIYGMQLVTVSGDGNCFFHAMFEQLKKRHPGSLEDLARLLGKEVNHLDLKQLVVDILMRTAEEGLLSEEIMQEIDNYIIEADRNEVFGDHIIIEFFAKALDITIVLISNTGYLPRLINPGNDVTVYLGYHPVLPFQSVEGEPNEVMINVIKEVALLQLDESGQSSDQQNEPDRSDVSSSSHTAVDITSNENNDEQSVPGLVISPAEGIGSVIEVSEVNQTNFVTQGSILPTNPIQIAPSGPLSFFQAAQPTSDINIALAYTPSPEDAQREPGSPSLTKR